MEMRGRVSSLELTASLLESLGAKKVESYTFEDRIYFLTGKTSLEEGYTRIRTPHGSNNDSRYRITQKIKYKGENVEAFKSYSPDLATAKNSLHGSWLACIITRKGVEYQIENGKIFIENIEEFGFSVETEFPSRKECKEWLEKLSAKDINEYSLPLQFMMHKNKAKEEPKEPLNT